MVKIVEADTEVTPFDLGVYATRNTWVGGGAVRKASEKIKEKLLHIAADLFSTDLRNIDFIDGKAVNTNTDDKASIAELVLFSFKDKQQDVIAVETYHSPCGVQSYGVHFATVKVDTKTGKVIVLDYVAVHDAGRVLNPIIVEGQVEGGIQMGIGYALQEELKLDKETGRVVNAHLKRYNILKAKDMPPIKISFVESEELPGPFGAKGIGEIATVPVAPAIINAINDALNTRFTDLPITSDRIIKTLVSQKQGEI